MWRYFIFIVFLVNNSFAGEIKVFYNNLFYFGADSSYKINFEDFYCLQGYGLFGDRFIFAAYLFDGGDASTNVCVYDINEKKMYKIGWLPLTGESFFSYNETNDYVIFSWHNGINIFKLHDEEGKFITKIKPKNLFPSGYCPYWFDEKTILYTDSEKDKEVIVKKDISEYLH